MRGGDVDDVGPHRGEQLGMAGEARHAVALRRRARRRPGRRRRPPRAGVGERLDRLEVDDRDVPAPDHGCCLHPPSTYAGAGRRRGAGGNKRQPLARRPVVHGEDGMVPAVTDASSDRLPRLSRATVGPPSRRAGANRPPRPRQLPPRPPGLVHRQRPGRVRVGDRGLHRPAAGRGRAARPAGRPLHADHPQRRRRHLCGPRDPGRGASRHRPSGLPGLPAPTGGRRGHHHGHRGGLRTPSGRPSRRRPGDGGRRYRGPARRPGRAGRHACRAGWWPDCWPGAPRTPARSRSSPATTSPRTAR